MFFLAKVILEFFQFFHSNFNLVHCARKKLLDFHESWLILLGKIFSTTLLFPISKVQFSVIKSVEAIFRKEFFFKIAIFEDFPLYF